MAHTWRWAGGALYMPIPAPNNIPTIFPLHSSRPVYFGLNSKILGVGLNHLIPSCGLRSASEPPGVYICSCKIKKKSKIIQGSMESSLWSNTAHNLQLLNIYWTPILCQKWRKTMTANKHWVLLWFVHMVLNDFDSRTHPIPIDNQWWTYYHYLPLWTRKQASTERLCKVPTVTQLIKAEDSNVSCLVPDLIIINHYKYVNVSWLPLWKNKTLLLPLSCFSSGKQEGLQTTTILFLFPSVRANCSGHFIGESQRLWFNHYFLGQVQWQRKRFLGEEETWFYFLRIISVFFA